MNAGAARVNSKICDYEIEIHICFNTFLSSQPDVFCADSGRTGDGKADGQAKGLFRQPDRGVDRQLYRRALVDRNQADPLLLKPETQTQMQLQQNSLSKANEIFGHSVFKSSVPNFLPSYNIPTPENYRLSAGDEVIIDVWGAVVTNIRTTLSPEGSITIPNLGPVYLNGQTVAQAEKSVRSYLSKIYSGIESDMPDTFVKLSLGKTRSVTVGVIGEVSALTTVSSAIYMAGGLTHQLER